jgi:hypothetical protein
LTGGNFSLADAVKEMIKKSGREILAANLRHGYSP